MNALKRYEKGETDDKQTPLHACITWNLADVALALIKNGANVDMQVSIFILLLIKRLRPLPSNIMQYFPFSVIICGSSFFK